MKKLLFILMFFVSFCYSNNEHYPTNISARMEINDFYIESCIKFINRDYTSYYCTIKKDMQKYSDISSFYYFLIDDFGITMSDYNENYPNNNWYYYISNDDVIGEFSYTSYDNEHWVNDWSKGKVSHERAEHQRKFLLNFLKEHTFSEEYLY